eukprot:CAMPEP_0198297028 /NCGR_PEP_ID=MMETSP1449-20131203/35064_1 /TAXON_ID=420275 /ORGANISM="Attheya septentrionalis, Strain CCMP2084" /LENGTH=499 /DNA_ID=CAMNT_0043997825 /DNA_START=26 /DNA_END=1525 /DNA_ORIENTATION=-
MRRRLTIRLIAALAIFLVSSVPSVTSLAGASRGDAKCRRIAVIGGGASGMFAATAAADALQNHNGDSDRRYEVVVLEGGKRTMTKVAISGGGRCNVLHDTSKTLPEILNGYPRGKKELTGLMTKRFSPTQAEEWFTSRGVTLKTEKDGRMFPTSDNSQTIIDTITTAAEKAGVIIRTSDVVSSVEKRVDENHFVISHSPQGNSRETKPVTEIFDSIIMATGSSPKGHELVKELGHTIIKPVPSLFTLSAKHQVKEGGIFNGLSGVSVPDAIVSFKVAVPGKKKKKIFSQEGPLLITHHGLSGPAALRLSAFAAREFHDENYRGDVFVHWAPHLGTAEEIEEALWQITITSPKRAVSSGCPLFTSQLESQTESPSSSIPKRLWAAFAFESGFDKNTIWSEAPKKKVRVLSRLISEFVVDMTGKGVFKEEFVTAGGISLKEIDMKQLESKKCSGLFCCGEVLDVDGVTGGFNFMNCWSTGYIAGNSAADRAQKESLSSSIS